MTEMREFDGWNAKGKRPWPEAYRKTVLEPDPTDAAVARAECEVWRAALDVLVVDLREALVATVALPSRWPERPWEAGAAAMGRVLPDLTVAATVLTPQRLSPRKSLSTRACGHEGFHKLERGS